MCNLTALISDVFVGTERGLRHVGGDCRIANSARRPLAIQADFLLIEDAHEVAFDFHKLV